MAADSTAALSLAGASITDTVPVLLCSTHTTPIWLGGSSMTTASTNLGVPFIGTGGTTPVYFTYNLLASDPLFAITTGAEVTVIAQAGRQS